MHDSAVKTKNVHFASTNLSMRIQNMSQCYEVYMLEILTRDVEGTVVSRRASWEPTDEAADAVDRILERYGRNSFEYFNACDVSFARSGYPWATIIFEQEYRLAGHVVSIRGSSKEMPFSNFSNESAASRLAVNDVPSVSVVFAMNKDALEKAAGKSPLLFPAWNALKGKDASRHWICIPDPPPENWVEATSQGDDELFLQVSNS